MLKDIKAIKCPPSVKAICDNNIDRWREKRFDELIIGQTYTPDYMVIGRSWSYLLIKEYPGMEYNTTMFTYQDSEGHSIDFTKDIVHPIMERYREYLWHEMNQTGTWEVWVQLNDNPVTCVPEKNIYRVVRYGVFNLERERIGNEYEEKGRTGNN